MRVRALAAACLVSLFVASTGARAAGVDPAVATPVQREQAQARFVRGKQLYERRSFEAALTEFRASHDIVASPNSRLYLARSLRELGRRVEAYVELGRAEVEAREMTRTDNRYQRAAEAAGEERNSLRKALGFVTVKIAGAEETTELVVGDETIRRGGWSEPIPVKPGTTEVRLQTPGRVPLTRSVTLEAGGTTSLDLDAKSAESIAAPAPAATPMPAPEAPPPEQKSLRPYAFAAGGLAVAGFTTFTIFGLMAKGTHDDLTLRCAGGACAQDPSDDASAGRTQQTIANIGLVVGAVGLAGATALFIAEPKPHKAATVRPLLGVGRIGITGRF